MKCEICGTNLRAEPAITETGWVIFHECIVKGNTEQEAIDNYEKIRASATRGKMWDDLTDEQRAKLVEAVEECCDGMYWCQRVWSAWSYDTMGQNDFVPADNCEDFLIDVVKSVLDRASKIGEVGKIRKEKKLERILNITGKLFPENLDSIKHEKCDFCGNKLISNCLVCGEPVCCPECCKEARND